MSYVRGLFTLVAIVVVLAASLEASRRWPTLGVAVALGLIGLGVVGLADPPSHHDGFVLEGFGDAFVRFLSVLTLAIGAVWLLASGVAVRARRKRRTLGIGVPDPAARAADAHHRGDEELPPR